MIVWSDFLNLCAPLHAVITKTNDHNTEQLQSGHFHPGTEQLAHCGQVVEGMLHLALEYQWRCGQTYSHEMFL
jgi:hypothetical protein